MISKLSYTDDNLGRIFEDCHCRARDIGRFIAKQIDLRFYQFGGPKSSTERHSSVLVVVREAGYMRKSSFASQLAMPQGAAWSLKCSFIYPDHLHDSDSLRPPGSITS